MPRVCRRGDNSCAWQPQPKPPSTPARLRPRRDLAKPRQPPSDDVVMPLLEATPLLPLSDVGHRMTSPRHAADPDTPPCHLTSVAASPDQATPAKPPPPLPSRRCLHLGPSGTYDLCDRDREAAGRPRQAAVVGQDAGARDCECGATRRSRQATAGRDATPATLASVTAKPSADLAKPVPSRRTDAVAATSPHFCGEEKNLVCQLLLFPSKDYHAYMCTPMFFNGSAAAVCLL